MTEAFAGIGCTRCATRTVASQAASTDGHISTPTPASRAVCRALFSLNSLDRMTVHVRLNLSPECRARAPAANSNAPHRHTHLLENTERVFQAEGHALHNCANNMAARVKSGDAGKHSTGFRIQMRCALAHQVRRPQQSIRTGG